MSRARTLLVWGIAAVIGAALAAPAAARQEYYDYIRKTSGRPIDCAMCHVNPSGPEGHDAGQIGSLTPEQLEQLKHARAAFDPGQEVHNPTLNAFGNHILQVVGRQRFLDLRSDPARLATELGAISDLDGDGIPDSREYRDGTHPLKPRSGDPGLLLLTNLRRGSLELALILLATVLGLYGLSHLMRGIVAARPAGPPAH